MNIMIRYIYEIPWSTISEESFEPQKLVFLSYYGWLQEIAFRYVSYMTQKAKFKSTRMQTCSRYYPHSKIQHYI